MSYFPIFEYLQKMVKDSLKWFFVNLLFCTKELQVESERYFATGQTSFRYFEWLYFNKVREAYPKKWKLIVADFFGAYLKLILIGSLCIASVFIFLKSILG